MLSAYYYGLVFKVITFQYLKYDNKTDAHDMLVVFGKIFADV